MAAVAGGQVENSSNVAIELSNRWLSRAEKCENCMAARQACKNKSTIFQIAFNFAS